jgi:hypothetical protein
MELAHVRLCDLLEFSVVLLQVFGIAALCLSRLLRSSRLARHARAGFIVAMIGLGIAGAICGRQDSEFALFAGGTMTVLLIGMTLGGTPLDASMPPAISARSA